MWQKGRDGWMLNNLWLNHFRTTLSHGFTTHMVSKGVMFWNVFAWWLQHFKALAEGQKTDTPLATNTGPTEAETLTLDWGQIALLQPTNRICRQDHRPCSCVKIKLASRNVSVICLLWQCVAYFKDDVYCKVNHYILCKIMMYVVCLCK